MLIFFKPQLNIVLGRPTDKSITASVMFDQQVDFYVDYGTQTGSYTGKITTITVTANKPEEIYDLNLIISSLSY
jgi:hypothetical protein